MKTVMWPAGMQPANSTGLTLVLTLACDTVTGTLKHQGPELFGLPVLAHGLVPDDKQEVLLVPTGASSTACPCEQIEENACLKNGRRTDESWM
jgi:hypothetical protein